MSHLDEIHCLATIQASRLQVTSRPSRRRRLLRFLLPLPLCSVLS